MIDPDDETPVHAAFGLTYAGYFVLHRSLMEAMPADWQRRFASLVDEYWDTYDSAKVPDTFEVRLRDERGRWLTDPFHDYRHPDRDKIAAARRTGGDIQKQ